MQIRNNSLKQRMVKKTNDCVVVLAFLLPALIVYGTYNVRSIIMTFYYSLQKWSGFDQMHYIGLQNYVKLMGDPMIWHALRNNLLLVVVSIIVQLSFGLILALIISAKIKGTKVFRLVYFMPMLLSTVATGILWQLLYDPNFGLINEALRALKLDSLTHAWIGETQTVMGAVLTVICWQYIPQYMILLRAGMTGIPDELYEAATIDGATEWKQFWSITLPLLMPTIKISATLAMVGSLKYFDLIYIMTGGGPNGFSELMATYMYKKAFGESNMGYASAIAGFMFIVSLILVLIFRTSTRNKETGR